MQPLNQVSNAEIGNNSSHISCTCFSILLNLMLIPYILGSRFRSHKSYMFHLVSIPHIETNPKCLLYIAQLQKNSFALQRNREN